MAWAPNPVSAGLRAFPPRYLLICRSLSNLLGKDREASDHRAPAQRVRRTTHFSAATVHITYRRNSWIANHQEICDGKNRSRFAVRNRTVRNSLTIRTGRCAYWESAYSGSVALPIIRIRSAAAAIDHNSHFQNGLSDRLRLPFTAMPEPTVVLAAERRIAGQSYWAG